ncbi:hypothetical protein [Pseudomonas sp. RIT-PI-S]|uniref:hypothetical protein n=1 Tax=Pseudomonas sp. RIT-PI-S TaxID=3035295 RepID=UPI0021D803CD|nr:hypothetical protein [Pseudomonas sp. RIT-PI-S]
MTLHFLRRALYSAALLCCALPALAGDAADAPADFIVGVHTRLFNLPRPVQVPFKLMHEAGIRSVRDDAFWSTVEQQPGVLRISPDWTKYLRAQHDSGMSNVLMLGYGNRFYSSDSKPIYPTVRAGFARFVDYVARQLKGQVGFYEVYNEWDLEDSLSPAYGDAYLELVQDTSRQLRRIDPKARILGGAVTSYGIKVGFADRLLQGGLLKYADGLSLHPYVHCEKTNGGNTPESWIRWMRQVSAHLDDVAGQPVPLYLTEMAWHSTGRLHPCGVDEDTQAAFLARAYLLAKTLPAIRGMWWYDLANDGYDPAEQEHNFGLLRRDLSPKPAYEALKRIAPVLNDYHYVPGPNLPAAEGSDDLLQLEFRKGTERVLAVWTAGPPRTVTLQLPSGPTQVHASEMPQMIALVGSGEAREADTAASTPTHSPASPATY